MISLHTSSRRTASCLVRRFSTLRSQQLTVGRVSTMAETNISDVDAGQEYRRQHHLAASTGLEHHQATRQFVRSVHTAVRDSPAVQSSEDSKNPTPLLQTEGQPEVVEEFVGTKEENQPREELQSTSTETEDEPQEKQQQDSENQEITTSKAEGKTSKPVQKKHQPPPPKVALGQAIRRNDPYKAVNIFREAVKNDQLISHHVVMNLFYLLAKSDPFMAYRTLQYYDQHPNTKGASSALYRKLCESVRLLDPQKARQQNIHNFIETLLSDLESKDNDVKQECYPKLIAALATQRSVGIGPHAGVLFNYMKDNEMEMTQGWLKKILSLSKYNRQEDLPFHEILSKLAETKARPHPLSTIPAIQNMFPYTDSVKMCTSLRAVLQIQQQIQENGIEFEGDHLVIDLVTLEVISTGAAHSGSAEQILLVWDLLEQCNYKPTETIYENTVIAFAATGDDLPAAFGAMSAMKEDGFEVSRALIRSFSRAIRSHRIVIDEALDLLTSSDSSEELACLEALNTVMSCYAERGDVHQTLVVLETIRRKGLKPNSDSYSFAIEVLGKDIHRRKKTEHPADIQKNVGIAGSILTDMEADTVAPSSDFVRNYAELLCIANEIKTATSLVQRCLKEHPGSVNSKTLYRVALANAEEGDFEAAKHLASHVTDNIPILHKKIRSKQQRFLHLQRIKGDNDSA